MSNNNNNNVLIIDSENKTSPAEIFFIYLSYLPLYIVSLTLCIAGALIILRYIPNKYKNTATLLVKGDDKAGASRGGSSSIVLCLYVLFFQLLIVVIDINVYCYCRNQFAFSSISNFRSCRFPISVLVDFQFPFLSISNFRSCRKPFSSNSRISILYSK